MRPKKSEEKLLEELVEVEQWATANLDVLRLRDGDCFKAKLRQLVCDEEKRIYMFLVYHRKRLEASAALAAQLAKLDCIVMAPGDTSLHAAVPSAASGSRKARCSTDARLSALDEGTRWPPKKCENSFLEEFAEVEQWARANINVLRVREGDGFKSKLRQLNGSEEKRIYMYLTKHKERVQASVTLAAQLANLDCMVRNHPNHHGSNSPEWTSDRDGFGDGVSATRSLTRDGRYGEIKKRDSEKEMLLQVQRCHFDAIKSERKRWEGRPLVERRKDGSFAPWRFLHLATEGRVVKFQSGPPPNLALRVVEVRRFLPNKRSSITPEQAMVMELGSELLPDAADAGARVQVYRDIYGADRCAGGFVAMRLQWADGMKLAEKSADAERSQLGVRKSRSGSIGCDDCYPPGHLSQNRRKVARRT